MLDHTFTYPPTIQRAQIHAQATQIFKKVDPQQLKRCQCCERIVGSRQNVSCCHDPKQMAFLGQGIPLYFLMIRNCIALIVVILAGFGAYSLYSNYMGDECSSGLTKCEVSIFNQLCILNKSTNTQMLQLQNYMVMGTIFAIVIAMQFVRRAARVLEAECDRLVDSPSDYSMIIRGLPEGYEERDIMDMIEKRRKFLTASELQETQGLAVQKIVIAYSLKAINETKEKNIQNFKKSIKEKTKFVQLQLPKANKLSPTAVVVFSSQKSKDYFITQPKLYQKIAQFFWSVFIPKSDYTVKDTFVSIQRAPEPDDINWENCGISLCGAICRRLTGLLVTLLFLGLGAALQIGLQYFDQTITDPTIKNYSSTVFSLIVSLFNGIIGALLIIVTKKERIETVTEYNQRLAVKISVYQFINAGVLVIISNSILDFKNFSLSNGLAAECTLIMAMNVVFPNLILFIVNYAAPMKWWKRRSIRKTLQTAQPKDIYIQQQVNQIFEDVDIDLAARYSFILRTLWLTALFAPFIPIVLPLSILSLFLHYYIQKLLFIKAYKVPNMTSSILDNEMIEMLEYIPIVLSLGNYFLYLYFVRFVFEQVPTYYGIPIYVSIGVSVLNMFLPMDGLNHKIFPLKGMDFRRPFFKQVEHKFITDYDIANPIYRIQNKKKKNFQFFQKLTPLGQMIEMGQLDGDKRDQNANQGNPANNPFAALFAPQTQNQQKQLPLVLDSPAREQRTPLLKKTQETDHKSEMSSKRMNQSWEDSEERRIMNRLKPQSPVVSVKNLFAHNEKKETSEQPEKLAKRPPIPPLNLHKLTQPQPYHHQNTMPLPSGHPNLPIDPTMAFMAPMAQQNANFMQGPMMGSIIRTGSMGQPQMGPPMGMGQPNQMNFGFGRPSNPFM